LIDEGVKNTMAWLFKLVSLAILIYVTYWIYTDANKRNMNGVLWAILTFFTCPIAPIIYLIMRKPA